MQGKIVLITGANAGIGKATALALAKKGATVVLACRTQEKGDQTKAEFLKTLKQADVHAIECDLASLESIGNAARQFLQSFQHLDVLINNAGLFTSNRKRTADGFEMQFGVNYLGHFLLTKAVLPALQKVKAPRVINVSSIAHHHAHLQLDQLKDGPNPYNGLQAYAQSKLANVLFTRELIRKYPSIISHSLHPGVVRTQFGNKHSKWYLSLFWHFWKMFMVSSQKGAATSIYLASSDELPEENGLFFDEKQRIRTAAAAASNDILAKQLWELSEQLIAEASAKKDQSQLKDG